MRQNGQWRIVSIVSMGLISALVLGFIMGRVLLPDPLTMEMPDTGRVTMSPVISNPAGNASTPNSARGNVDSQSIGEPSPQTNERLTAIDEELKRMPADREDELMDLTENIRQRRIQVAQLLAQIQNSDRELLTQNLAVDPDAGAKMAIYERARIMLADELRASRNAVSEQRYVVANTIGPANSTLVLEARAELARREADLAAMELRVRTFFEDQAYNLDLQNAQKSRMVDSWRSNRANLEGMYADTLLALERDLQAHSDLSASIARDRQRREALEAEAQTIIERGADGG